MVGHDGARAFWFLIHHSTDDDFQRTLLPFIKKAYKNGTVTGQQYAHFVDKVLIHDGKPQKYGTQLKPLHEWINGTPIPYEIEDPQNINALRASVGLFNLEDYLQIAKSSVFPEEGSIFPVEAYNTKNGETEIGVQLEVIWTGTIDEMTVKSLDITKVKKESSADKAGIKVGDKIIEIDGITVEGSKMITLEQAMDKPAGKNVSLVIKKPDCSRNKVTVNVTKQSKE